VRTATNTQELTNQINFLVVGSQVPEQDLDQWLNKFTQGLERIADGVPTSNAGVLAKVIRTARGQAREHMMNSELKPKVAQRQYERDLNAVYIFAMNNKMGWL